MPGLVVSLLIIILPGMLVVLTWQDVSDSFPGAAVPLLITLLSGTLVVLTWQFVSDLLTGPAVSLLIIFLPNTLVVLTWQDVSDSLPGPAVSLFTILLHWHSDCINLTACEWFTARSSCVSSHDPSTWYFVVLTWQVVSDSLPGLAVSLLMIFLLGTLIVLT